MTVAAPDRSRTADPAGHWDLEEGIDLAGCSLGAVTSGGLAQAWLVVEARATSDDRTVSGTSPLVAMSGPGATTTRAELASDGLVRPVLLAQGALLVSVEPPGNLRF